MTGPNRIEDLLAQAERRALVAVLRAKPEITLDKLQDCFGGRHGSTLRSITVAELRTAPTGLEIDPDDWVMDVHQLGTTSADFGPDVAAAQSLALLPPRPNPAKPFSPSAPVQRPAPPISRGPAI